MRLSWLGWSLGLVGFLAAGCVVENAADDPADGGTAGTAGSGGGTTIDAGNPCGDVTADGMCVDPSTIRTCIITDTANEPPRLVETTCSPGRGCQEINGVAQCVVLGECVDGDVVCSFDGKWVRRCQSGAYVDEACDTDNGYKCAPGSPGEPAGCKFVPSSTGGNMGPTIRGRVKYEYRPTRADNLGWGDIDTIDVIDLYVTIFDNGEFIGAALSGWNPETQEYTGDGTFIAEMIREPVGPTQVWVWPMVFNYKTGLPMMAVAKLANTDVIDNAREANEYWAWGYDVPAGSTDIGEWTIKESEGSGALHIFAWTDAGLLRTQSGISDDQQSVVVYWNPAMQTPSCGACFCGPQCGGAQLQYGTSAEEVDYYDSWMAIGGPPDDGSTQWAKAVISHEFGHYVMNNYSLSPGEGGPHYVGQASKPGLAYSEAWATSFAATNVGTPVYVDEQYGSFFYVDISKYEYSSGSLAMPDPNGGIDQHLNENVAAGMIWKLWVDGAQDADGRGLGDPKIFGTLTTGNLVNGTYNRGYEKVDLVDFFDAAICSGNATDADVSAVCATTGFPYNPADKPCQ